MHDSTTSRAIQILIFTVLSIACLEAPAVAEEDPDALFSAVRAGDLGEVKRLVEAGAAVDAVDAFGAPPLVTAASAGRLELVRYLLDEGADPDQRETFYHQSAAGWALGRGHREVVLLLLERGADAREEVLDFAVSEGDVDLAEAAVKAGPIYASRLEALRRSDDQLDPALRRVLDRATSRKDPPPPRLSASELERYIGLYEERTADTLVEVTLGDDRLYLAIGADEPMPLKVVAEHTFRSVEGDVEAAFFGRTELVEGLSVKRGDEQPMRMRRSVAEPPKAVAEVYSATESGGSTVHWPGFRGNHADGIGDGVEPPTAWDLESEEGVLWQVALPGLGNSSPIVWGDRVFVTTAVAEGIEQQLRTGLTGDGTSVPEAVEHSWQVLAFDKKSGKRLWTTEVGRGVPLTERHFKASQANSTPATDGRYLVAIFPTAGLAALDLDGKLLWKHDLGGLNAGAFSDPTIEWGFASSPVIHGSRVIQQLDLHDGQALVAWDLESGEEVWRTERDVAPSWATPTILEGEGGVELVVNGSTIHGYDPANGKQLWSLGPNSALVIATPVVDEGVAYVSAGYPPAKPIYAIKAGMRGDFEIDPDAEYEQLAWSIGRGGAYMPTPLLYGGLLYIVHHNGRLVAYDAATGGAVLKSRFSRGGVFTGSPVAANGKLYMPTEDGLLYVLEAGPVYKEIAVHDFGEPLMATPAISEGILLVRSPTRLIALSGLRSADD